MFGKAGSASKYLGQAARMLVGVPDYDNYVEHMRNRHPDLPAMSYEEFFVNVSRQGMAETVKAACVAVNQGESMTPVKVTLLSGFLGAGKRPC